jgi:hypothetical protein
VDSRHRPCKLSRNIGEAPYVRFALFILAFILGIVAAHAEPLTIGTSYTLVSKTLGETRRINVYAPPGFDAADAPPLPVLYVLDGGVKEDFLHIAGLVQVSVGNATMRPFLVVGIENTQRRRDFTGPTANAEDKKIAPVVGGSAAFRTFLKDELLPDVARRFKTTGETAIVGESLAGLFIVETLFDAPDLFATYIAVDPSLWWNDDALLRKAPGWAKAHDASKASLFLAGSDERGNGKTVAEFARRLQAEQGALRLVHEAMRDETHATIFHPAALKAFRTMFAPPKP